MLSGITCAPVDVVVVGAGLGGGAFCARLSQMAPQLKIVCVEGGGWFDRRDLPAHRTNWQELALGPWAPSPNLRAKFGNPGGSADYPIDESGSVFKPLMWNGVGGSTINW